MKKIKKLDRRSIRRLSVDASTRVKGGAFKVEVSGVTIVTPPPPPPAKTK